MDVILAYRHLQDHGEGTLLGRLLRATRLAEARANGIASHKTQWGAEHSLLDSGLH